MKRLGEKLLGVHSLLVLLFLYLPILILVVFSFNTSRLNVMWEGFTFNWYREMVMDRQIIGSLQNSLIVAGITTAVSTVMGTVTAMAMARYRFVGKRLLEGLLYIPIILPEIVMGISMLAFFTTVGVRLGLATIAMAHITFCTAFVVLVVRARLHGFDRTLERAAMDLGASPWMTFRRITLPLIAPGIWAGALIAFTLSLDDVIITFFTAGPGSTTLSLYVFSMVRLGVSPKVNALSTVILLVTFAAIILVYRGMIGGRRQEEPALKEEVERLVTEERFANDPAPAPSVSPGARGLHR